MSIATPGLTNFTAGELSPRLEGRVDLAKYHNGCRKLENFHVHPHGGATRRSGLRFVTETIGGGPSLLVPFEFNAEQTYLLEFGEETPPDGGEPTGAMRVFTNRGLVLYAERPAEDAGDDGGTDDGGDSGTGSGDGDDSSGDGSENAGTPGEPVRIASPYRAEELDRLRWVQSNDTLLLVHPNHPPRSLTRTAHDRWTLTDIAFQGAPEEWAEGNHPSSICFFEERLVLAATPKEPGRLWLSRKSEYYDLRPNTRQAPLENWSTRRIDDTRRGVAGETFTLEDYGFFEKGEGVRGRAAPGEGEAEGEVRYYRYKGAVELEAADGDLTVTFTDGTPGAKQIESVTDAAGGLRGEFWSEHAPGDHVDNDSGEPLDTDAIIVTLSAAKASAVEFVIPRSRLWLGTTGGEWSLGAASGTEALSPLNAKAQQEGDAGAATVMPEAVGDAALFVGRGGGKLREMAYRFESDGVVSQDLTILAEHIAGPGLTRIAYAREPDSVLYAARADGLLVSFTYNRDQEVLSWARHPTDGFVERVATVYSARAARHELWAVVRREGGGTERRCIELLEDEFAGDDPSRAFFVDSGVSYDGEPAAVLTGLAHLAGRTVQVLADGAVHPDRVVDPDGSLRLSRPASKVHAGLGYVSALQPMRLEAGSMRGTAQTKRKRLTQVSVRFHDTLGGKVGPDEANLETIHFRSSASKMGGPPALWTGDRTVKFPAGWDRDGLLTVVQDQPLPMTVLMIVPEAVVNE